MTRNTLRVFTAMIAVVALLGAPGCSQHDDLPSPLSIITPPTPTNVTVVEDGFGLYGISWTVDNEGIVDHYRVYTLSFGPPSLEGTSPTREFGLNTIIPVGGIVIGVSAVTVDNVEGAMGTGVTPAP